MITALLMAVGQVAHGYEEFTCASDHPMEQHEPGSDCPVGDCCCHGHVKLALADYSTPLFVCARSGSFLDAEESSLDGPFGEIEYPPQLS